MRTQEAPIYFFSFDYSQQEKKVANSSLASVHSVSPAVGFGSEQSYTVLPSAKNEIIVRFENLADRFNGADNSSIWNLDLQKFAVDLYQGVNSAALPEVVKI